MWSGEAKGPTLRSPLRGHFAHKKQQLTYEMTQVNFRQSAGTAVASMNWTYTGLKLARKR